MSTRFLPNLSAAAPKRGEREKLHRSFRRGQPACHGRCLGRILARETKEEEGESRQEEPEGQSRKPKDDHDNDHASLALPVLQEVL